MVRERLRAREPLAWTLRRFEADLLEALGVGFEFSSDGDGEPIDPAARYRIDPEHGPRRLLSDRGQGERSHAAPAARCSRWPRARRRPDPTTWPACAARCARCLRTSSAAAR